MKRSWIRCAAVLSALGAMPGAPVRAQVITAEITGLVRDASQAVLPGATVSARNIDTGFERVATSNARGRYVLFSLPPGPYQVRVEMTGFNTVVRERIELSLDQRVEIDFDLAMSGVAETVTVEESAPLFSTTKADLGRVLKTDTVDNIPSLGRDYRNLVALAPGVRSIESNSPRVAGNPYYSNTWKIDGVENDSESVANPQSRITQDAVAEVQVATNQFSAEYGRALGGAINVITRSGTNELHGRGFYYHQDGGWNAKNHFARNLPQPEFTTQLYGATLGGPLVRDRTHFFVSGERVADDRPVVLRDPAGGPSQTLNRPTRNWTVFSKVSHRLSDAHSFQFAYLFDSSLADGEGVGGISQPSHGFVRDVKNHLFIASDVGVLSPTVVNEVRVQFQRRDQLSTPNTAQGPEIVRPSSITGRDAGLPFGWDENKIQIVDNLTKVAGDHSIKVGANLQFLFGSDWLNESNFGGSFTFTTDRPFNPADASTYPTLYRVASGDPTTSLNNNIIGLFVQDSWKATPKLTLNLGLRYDRESGDVVNVFKNFPDNDNFGPRLSFAWTPWSDQKTVVRGGYGRFYFRLYGNLGVNMVVQGAPPPDGIGSTRTSVIVNPGYPDPYSGNNPNGSRTPTALKQGGFSDGNEVSPFADTLSVGISRELGRNFAVSADYVSTRGKHYSRAFDTNFPDPVTGLKPRPDYAQYWTYDTDGHMWYDGLMVKVEKRMSRNYQFLVSYTLSKTLDDTWAQFITQGAGPQAWWNPEAEKALSATSGLNADDDERHHLTVSGIWRLPLGFELSGVMQAASDRRYNITTGRDNNGDTVLADRPNLVNGQYVDPGTGPGVAGNLGKNAGIATGYFGLDMRAAWTLDLKGNRLKLIAEGYNVTNKVNYTGYVGNMRSALFQQASAARRPRTVQVGAQFDF